MVSVRVTDGHSTLSPSLTDDSGSFAAHRPMISVLLLRNPKKTLRYALKRVVDEPFSSVGFRFPATHGPTFASCQRPGVVLLHTSRMAGSG